jgi:phosphatidylglycerophosphate synthase
MPATFLAKTKTAVIMFGMAIYLGAMAFELKYLIMIGILVTFVGALMSLFTGVQYLQKFNANKKA